MFSRFMVCFSYSFILFVLSIFSSPVVVGNPVISEKYFLQKNTVSQLCKKQNSHDGKKFNSKHLSQQSIHHEPEQLTFGGAVGLAIVISIIGGLSYWAMGPLSGELDDEDDDLVIT